MPSFSIPKCELTASMISSYDLIVVVVLRSALFDSHRRSVVKLSFWSFCAILVRLGVFPVSSYSAII